MMGEQWEGWNAEGNSLVVITDTLSVIALRE
jgi:hypothetical protein